MSLYYFRRGSQQAQLVVLAVSLCPLSGWLEEGQGPHPAPSQGFPVHPEVSLAWLSSLALGVWPGDLGTAHLTRQWRGSGAGGGGVAGPLPWGGGMLGGVEGRGVVSGRVHVTSLVTPHPSHRAPSEPFRLGMGEGDAGMHV